MGLGVFRLKGYLFGALTGALTAVALVGLSNRRYGRAGLALAGALACGTLSVANEEQAQRLSRPAEPPGEG